jgi:hypothetical protein
MNSISDCPLWPSVQRLKVDFSGNYLTSTVPFLKAFRRLKSPISIEFKLADN